MYIMQFVIVIVLMVSFASEEFITRQDDINNLEIDESNTRQIRPPHMQTRAPSREVHEDQTEAATNTPGVGHNPQKSKLHPTSTPRTPTPAAFGSDAGSIHLTTQSQDFNSDGIFDTTPTSMEFGAIRDGLHSELAETIILPSKQPKDQESTHKPGFAVYLSAHLDGHVRAQAETSGFKDKSYSSRNSTPMNRHALSSVTSGVSHQDGYHYDSTVQDFYYDSTPTPDTTYSVSISDAFRSTSTTPRTPMGDEYSHGAHSAFPQMQDTYHGSRGNFQGTTHASPQTGSHDFAHGSPHFDSLESTHYELHGVPESGSQGIAHGASHGSPQSVGHGFVSGSSYESPRSAGDGNARVASPSSSRSRPGQGPEEADCVPASPQHILPPYPSCEARDRSSFHAVEE